MQHTAGVESVLVSPDDSLVYTASRDATVRSWSSSGSDSWQSHGTFMGHCDWVTDAILVETKLITCSSDCCVALWEPKAQGAHLNYPTFESRLLSQAHPFA